LFAYGSADATAILKPHHLLPHLNPDWFYLSGVGLARLSWKRGRETGVCVCVFAWHNICVLVTVRNRLDEDGKVLTPEEILYRVCSLSYFWIRRLQE